MERHFILGDFNTWYDWQLILTAKDIPDPEPKENYVELDGRSGSLDLSEALTGEITYQDRTITATFWTDYGTRKDRERLLRDIRLALHGKKMRIYEPDDPEHYFIGRIKIKAETNILPYAEILLEAVCEPWRYAAEESTRRAEVNGSEVAVVINNHGAKTLSPVVSVDGSVRLYYNGGSAALETGSYKISDLKLYPGANVIKVYGTGGATFTYTEADL